MKKLLLLPILALSIFTFPSCKKTSTAMLNEMVDTTAVLKYQGTFAGAGSESVSGMAKIYLQNQRYYLALENFSTSNGPDLKVFLSEAPTPQNSIKLSGLKSTNGNQVYDINGAPDFTKLIYVLIHCEQFNKVFGRAELKKI
jgi:Electron transfer DM13